MAAVSYAFFVDFDGTITTSDVCYELVATFAGEGWREINTRWERKELSTLECARATFKLFRTKSPEDFAQLCERITLEEGFREFVAYCREKDFPVVILSDGYDYYIERLLKREGLELPYYANKLLFSPELDVEAPYQSDSCSSCGVCKLELLKKLHQPGQRIVYIGDSHSDFCPAQGADLVFAKTKLFQQYCLDAGKETRFFNNFFDILREITCHED
ncbi:MAG: MtnX-like HAD-IB family phosphatase [Firmicutes bacterium]|jgi:2-hydroxy-3-keto-5-methylthiopentenyl-1-phosphate phosphatase|nr:MtnX-like HAD-IB family phosphatase [Bacillota bacterium]